MEITLSNCEIKAYRNRKSMFVLHCKTVLIVDIGGWFFPGSYFDNIHFSAHFRDGSQINFEVIMHCDNEFEYDEQNNTYTFELKASTELTEIEEQVATIHFSSEINFPHGVTPVSHKQVGVLRKVGL